MSISRMLLSYCISLLHSPVTDTGVQNNSNSVQVLLLGLQTDNGPHMCQTHG